LVDHLIRELLTIGPLVHPAQSARFTMSSTRSMPGFDRLQFSIGSPAASRGLAAGYLHIKTTS